MNEPFVKGMEIVTKSLREDEGYFRAWQANIAMAFVDEARRQKARIGFGTLHNIANTAATNFLNLLIKEKSKKEKKNGNRTRSKNV